MHRSVTRDIFLAVLMVLLCGAPGQAQAPTSVSQGDTWIGRVTGTAKDSSAAVLPGVSVAAATVDGRSLATTVTSANGEFSFDTLPSGLVVLTFHLDGFVDATARVKAQGGAPVTLEQRLDLAAMAETVVVRADPPLPPPPPPPALELVPAHDEASVCGPAKADLTLPSFGTIVSSREGSAQGLFAAGDELIVEGGPTRALAVGQNFVVRRRYTTDWALRPGVFVQGEHSAGVLQIVAVEEHVATAVVVYACDALMTGDYLAAFQPEPIRQPEPIGRPDFERAARIRFADAGQMVGVENRMLVIDHGTKHGIRPGQRLTLFRRSRVGSGKPTVVGDAVVVTARDDSATIRVGRAADAIFLGDAGDWAAPQTLPGAETRNLKGQQQPTQVGRR